ncbi:MAG: DNA polymerase IV [Geminicoccaceae bacterium]|nr:DNA polymerase IV [Geminicoccaceae bacterium]
MNEGHIEARSHIEACPRRIIHIDMDAFYAAVEQRDRPELRGRPVAIGSASDRGVVLTASYEARCFGVRSAMPSHRARRLCPDLLFVRPRFEAYKAVSRQLHVIFGRYTKQFEPLSLDEAYLDVSAPEDPMLTATDIARSIKATIRGELHLTASAGVSYNKLLAKLGSAARKPDGLTVIRPEQAWAFLAALPVEALHGVGPVTARRLHAAGLHHGADLQAQDEARLTALLGRAGAHYGRLARGRDDRPVQSERRRLSLSVETTFDRDVDDRDALLEPLRQLVRELGARSLRAGFVGRGLTLKIKYADFRITTRSCMLPAPSEPMDALHRRACGLLDRSPLEAPVRLLGLGFVRARSHDDAAQMTLPLAPAPSSVFTAGR